MVAKTTRWLDDHLLIVHEHTGNVEIRSNHGTLPSDIQRCWICTSWLHWGSEAFGDMPTPAQIGQYNLGVDSTGLLVWREVEKETP